MSLAATQKIIDKPLTERLRSFKSMSFQGIMLVSGKTLAMLIFSAILSFAQVFLKFRSCLTLYTLQFAQL
jgi:hypothetical protein